MKKKLFILGIGGLTGSKLVITTKNDFEVYGSYNLRNPEFSYAKMIKLDLMDTEKVIEILSQIKPHIIINASAITSADYSETHQEVAKKINIDVVKYLCEFSNSIDSKFVHLSSDSVFEGTKKTPYVEEDIPNPINFFGYTKMEGEKIVLKDSRNLVVRASVLYGWLPKILLGLPSSSMKPANFAQWLIENLSSGKKVKIITDEYSSPIIAEDFADSIIHLIKNKKNGIYHCAPQIQINRYQFSVKLAKYLGLDWKLIQPITNQELGRKVKTANNKCLDSTKIIKETGYVFLTLEESFDLLKNQI